MSGIAEINSVQCQKRLRHAYINMSVCLGCHIVWFGSVRTAGPCVQLCSPDNLPNVLHPQVCRCAQCDVSPWQGWCWEAPGLWVPSQGVTQSVNRVNPRCQYSDAHISNPGSLRARQSVILKVRQGALVGGVVGYVHSCTAQQPLFWPKCLTKVQGPHVMICSPTDWCCGAARQCTVTLRRLGRSYPR